MLDPLGDAPDQISRWNLPIEAADLLPFRPSGEGRICGESWGRCMMDEEREWLQVVWDESCAAVPREAMCRTYQISNVAAGVSGVWRRRDSSPTPLLRINSPMGIQTFSNRYRESAGFSSPIGGTPQAHQSYACYCIYPRLFLGSLFPCFLIGPRLCKLWYLRSAVREEVENPVMLDVIAKSLQVTGRLLHGRRDSSDVLCTQDALRRQ